MTYSEKLRDPRWQKLRCELIEKANSRCTNCEHGHEDGPLQVHHLVYIRGKQPWEYDERFLKVLCDNCHMNWQINQESMQIALALMCSRRGMWHAYDLSKAFFDMARLPDHHCVVNEVEYILTQELRG
jgi:hypothetical protein